MAGESIRCVAAIGTGTIGASWTAEFLARGLTGSLPWWNLRTPFEGGSLAQGEPI